ncbi:centrosomal protein of 97 kDa isoform X2 [Anoplophora glabripennis]|uniref:centrosomal protein of 97 kDa isoform X2 n=1 Tax=Anoplophora glabripennis TaxID=217634 RepID=UPI0008742F97|nr:centrosomal protein of 97 kDa isoform X2 [Anoplophora glabripennis]
MEDLQDTLDLSNKKLKKLNKPTPAESQVLNLILDDNELQRLDNIDSFIKLHKLSAVHNQLLRMYGVCRLHSLHTLNLAHNGILTIEGLKELVSLKWLCLAGNSIKTIEHLQTNVNLEYLDLSENSITHITDLSFLKNLKELFLHKNKINHLSQCDRFLPTSLTTLTLAHNNITDLNEISRLVNLVNLTKISLANNPCVNMTGNNIGFDYRPFVINWCLNVNVIDDYVVDAIESLRAEWLYSQGRGRHYRVGDQKELTQYLATVCPLTGETLETEEDRKLRLILSKAQHHQQQLREQSSTNVTPNPSPMSRKKLQLNKQSPRLNSSRLSNRIKSPDRMVSSCYSPLNNIDNQSVMSQSLDPSILNQSIGSKMTESSNHISTEKCLDSEPINSPLQALSKMVPVPESLMSPDYRPSNLVSRNSTITPTLSAMSCLLSNKSSPARIVQPARSPKSNRSSVGRTRSQLGTEARKTGSPSPARQKKMSGILKNKPSSSEDESEICDAKLQTIQMKAEERRLQKDENRSNSSSNDDKVEQAAVFIQKMWRGYFTRNKDKEIQEMFKELQSQRANQYIQKLATDMETTKVALESERKIQMLQTEAISALWKKISALQPESEGSSSNLNMTNLSVNNAEVVKELAQTCTMLQTQIQQLQNSMQDIVKVMTVFSQSAGINHQLRENGISTQTDIVAVHTPQGEAGKVFPFQKQQVQSRPSSLPLPVYQRKRENSQSNSELQQFAGSLVDGVIKTVSETRADLLGHNTTDITVTDTDKLSEQNIEKCDVAT